MTQTCGSGNSFISKEKSLGYLMSRSVFDMKGNKHLVFLLLTTACTLVLYIVNVFMLSGDTNFMVIQYLGVAPALNLSTGKALYVHERLDTTPELTGPLPSLPNYKNPCWYEEIPEVGKKLRCLPYYYVIGVPKCGTTDLCNRITMHPLISSKVMKGNHWFTTFRYGKFHKLSNYLRLFDYAVETDIRRTSDPDGYHNAIFGDCTPSISWNSRHVFVEAKQNNLTEEPTSSNADVIKHLNPKSKIIAILRNPVERMYSEYLFFNGADNNPDEFHKRVVYSINNMTECLQNKTLRYCVYHGDREKRAVQQVEKVRIQVGIYHVFLEDFMKVFDRQQILIIKLENYSYNINQTMNKVYSFLDVGKVTDPDLKKNISKISPANTRSGGDKLLGDMLPETRELLTEFYKPYNERLTQLLGPDFDYNK